MSNRSPLLRRGLTALGLAAALALNAQAGTVSSSFLFQNLGTQGASGGAFYQAGDTAEQVYAGTPFLTIDQIALDAYFTSDFVGVDSPLFEVLVNDVPMSTFFGNNTNGGVQHLKLFGNVGAPGVAMTPNGTWHVDVVLTNAIPVGGGSVQFLDGGDYTPRVTLIHDDLLPPDGGGGTLPLPGTPALAGIAFAALGLAQRRRSA
jgi:hypothetical protein